MQEQKKFRYIFNGKEVSKEEFEKLAGDSFKWFDGDSIVSVPFSSFDNFFNGEFKSVRKINDHLDSVLDVYKNKVTEDIINKPICSPQCYCDGSCKKDLEVTLPMFRDKVKVTVEKNTNSTRHKSQNGETHTENLVYVKEGTGDEYLKRMMKDDVITSSNRGEKETMGYSQGVKESQSVDKAPIFTYCKVNKNALEALAFRALHGHKKYNKNGEDEDWQNFTRVPNAEEEYANAEFRHALEIGGEETEEEHLIASAWNAVARLEIFLRNKSK